MNSSGIKRGLATTAVAALAVTGLPFLASSASAAPLSDVTALTLVSPSADGVALSGKPDGTNSTVRLEAIGPASVTSVTFEYSLNGGTSYTTIGTATGDNGAFALEWDASPIAGATGVIIRANAGGTPAVVDSNNTISINNTLETVNITDGSSIGVFQSPYGGGQDYVAVSGTQSSLTADPALQFWNGTAFAGLTAADSAAADGATTATWAGVINIDGYPFSSNDQLLLKANAQYTAADPGAVPPVPAGAAGTEDTEAFDLYKQTITTVTATPKATNVPSGTTTSVTVKVTDQNNKPIAGARVAAASGGGAQTTDGNGEATFTQGAGSEFYYADATNVAGYNAELGDKRSDAVTVTQYNAAPTKLVASSVDGNAFDITEYSEATDISVQVKDQNDANIDVSDEQDLRYTWTYTPFGAGATPVVFPAPTATPPTSEQATETGGKFIVPLPDTDPSTGGVQRGAGTYVLSASLEANAGGNLAIPASNLLTVKTGEAALTWKTGTPAQAQAGGAVDVTGTLALADGTGLAGRSVKVDYANGGGANNAGIVLANGTTAATRTVTTGADGTFTVSVKDVAATPQTQENGTLTASTVPGTSDNDDPDADSAALTVQFLNNIAPATVTITPDNTAPTGTVDINTGGAHTPGELQEFDVAVRTADDPATPLVDESNAVTNSKVTVTLDHGYFTDGTPAATPTVGGDAGAYKDLGKSVEVTTDGSGVATVLVSIGRDAGFDDDGAVTATVTATAGTVNKTATHDWSSANPLNGGSVDIVESPEDRQDGPTGPAPLTNGVNYDVFVTDQFDNLVGNETVNLTLDDNDASFDDDSSDQSITVQSDFDERGEFEVFAERAGEYQVTGTWAANQYEYTVVTGNGTPTVGADENIVGTADVEFYAVDLAASTLTIASDPEGEVAVGTAVTETVKVVDQEGNPVPNLQVEFIRQGPGEQDGDPNAIRFTNANGEAFYSFTGTEAGTARISAVVSDGEQIQTLTDEVVFKAPAKADPQLVAKGKNNGKKADKVTADAIADAAGAKVTLWVKGKKVSTGTLNADGNFTFSVKDKNGKKATKYTVKVNGTKLTKTGQASKSIK